MRIGFLANTIESEAALSSGGHVHFIEVARRLKDDDVVVFAPRNIADALRSVLPAAQVVELPACERFTKNRAFVFLMRSVAALKELRLLRSCDVLLATSHFLPDVVPVLTARKNASIVIVHHIIASWRSREGNTLNNFIAFLAERASLLMVRARAKAIVAVSSYVASELRAMGFARLSIATNGIDHLDANWADDPRAVRSGALYLGRIHPTKGIEDLLRAWVFVQRALPEQQLTIAGRGEPSYVESLRRLSRDLGVDDSVRFAGYINEAEKRRALRSARVFVFPSKEEGWGIAIAEALGAGLPCVTYDLPVYRDLFDRGRLAAPTGDVRAFAELTIQALEDERRWASLADGAIACGRQFTWQRAADVERAISADVYASVR